MDDRQEELAWQKRAIDRARAGDEESAWIVMRAMMVELDIRYHDCHGLKRFTDFVEALLDSKDAAGHGSVTREQLAAVLDRLRVIRARGARKVDESVWDELNAAQGRLQADEAPVLRLAADFIQTLLTIKNMAPNAAPTRGDLVVAFDVLNIVSKPYRPETPYHELLGRLAAEKLEVLDGKSVADARARLRTGEHRLGELRQRDIRTGHPDLVNLVDGASREELEGLADNLLPTK